MKSCPTCNRTFEDSFSFCLVDGAILSAPYDPQATQRVQEFRSTTPPRTEVMNSNAERDVPTVPPTIISRLLEPTLPFERPEPPTPAKLFESDAKAVRNENKTGRIVLGFGAGVVVAYFLSMLSNDPKDVIPLGLFFGLVGAVAGKFASSLIPLIKKS